MTGIAMALCGSPTAIGWRHERCRIDARRPRSPRFQNRATTGMRLATHGHHARCPKGVTVVNTR